MSKRKHHSPAAVHRALRCAFASADPRHADATASRTRRTDVLLRVSQTPTALQTIGSATRTEGGKLAARASALRSGFASAVPQDAGLSQSKCGLRKLNYGTRVMRAFWGISNINRPYGTNILTTSVALRGHWPSTNFLLLAATRT